jgi:formate hydrogenlyase subunit 4
VVFFLAGAILSYIGGLLYPFQLGGREWPLTQLSRVLAVIVQLLLTVGIVWLMAALARRFRAPLRFEQLFKILGYAGIVFALTLVPSLMLVAFAWWFAAAYVALRGPGQLDAERALLVVLCGVIALFVVARLSASLGVYLWLGRWSPISFR